MLSDVVGNLVAAGAFAYVVYWFAGWMNEVLRL
jgi:hypothetical protein